MQELRRVDLRRRRFVRYRNFCERALHDLVHGCGGLRVGRRLARVAKIDRNRRCRILRIHLVRRSRSNRARG